MTPSAATDTTHSGATDAVQLINRVLANNGINVHVANFEQLQVPLSWRRRPLDCASPPQELKFTHYYIEIFERIFNLKIDGIEREPT